MILLRHARQLGDVDGISSEVNGIRLAIGRNAKVFCVNDETDAFMPRPVFARRGCDGEYLSSNANFALFPVLKADYAGSRGKVVCAVDGGKHPPAVEKLTAGRVEVVGVVLVAEEDRVDVGELVEFEGWVVMDFADAARELESGAGGGEEGIGEEGDAVDVEDGGSGADMGDGDFVLEG